MTTMTGLRERDAGERSYDRRSSAEETAEIEAAEDEFRALTDAWMGRHGGDRKAADGYLEDFLADYFFARRVAAAEQESGS